NRVPKGGSEKRTTAEKREYIRHCRPRGVSIAEGCRLMGIGRSAFYDTPEARARDLSIVAEMKTICDEFEAYGYRRVDAELRHRPLDRCTARCCCTQGRHRRPRSTKGLRASFRPWVAICLR